MQPLPTLLRPARLAATVLVLAASLAACKSDGRTLADPKPNQTATIRTTTTISGSTTSAADNPEITGMALSGPWQQGQAIDARFTCKGANLSPALTWTGVPDGTVELAIVMSDLDAQGYTHWVITGLDPKRGGILEGEVPSGARQATNSKDTVGYTGPCPPAGATHTYQLTLHAFKEPLAVINGMKAVEAMGLIEDKSTAATTLAGTFVGS